MNGHRAKLLGNPRYEIEAVKGELIMEVTERICEVMENENVARQDLAEKMGRTKGFVSQLLNSDRNMTLGTLAEIAFRLGYEPKFTMMKKSNKIAQTILTGQFETTEDSDGWDFQEDCIEGHAKVA